MYRGKKPLHASKKKWKLGVDHLVLIRRKRGSGIDAGKGVRFNAAAREVVRPDHEMKEKRKSGKRSKGQ